MRPKMMPLDVWSRKALYWAIKDCRSGIRLLSMIYRIVEANTALGYAAR